MYASYSVRSSNLNNKTIRNKIKYRKECKKSLYRKLGLEIKYKNIKLLSSITLTICSLPKNAD